MGEQRPVHPVDDRPVVLAGAAEPGAVLGDVGDEQVVTEQPAEGMQQRQRPDEAGDRAVGDVHVYLAAGLDQRAQHLPADRRCGLAPAPGAAGTSAGPIVRAPPGSAIRSAGRARRAPRSRPDCAWPSPVPSGRGLSGHGSPGCGSPGGRSPRVGRRKGQVGDARSRSPAHLVSTVWTSTRPDRPGPRCGWRAGRAAGRRRREGRTRDVMGEPAPLPTKARRRTAHDRWAPLFFRPRAHSW